MVGHGDAGAIAQLAPILFVGANIAVGLITLATLRLIIRRRLLPPAAPAAPSAARQQVAAIPGLIWPHLPSRNARIASTVLAGCSSISQ
jgi:hypothetical protein